MQEAYTIFRELGNFRDSHTIASEYEYGNALELLNAGQIAKAYAAMSEIKNYEPAERTGEELLAEHPYLSVLTAKTGETVVFGTYAQDNDVNGGPEAIEWYVLAHEDGNTLLISKYILDAQPFNTENRQECSLDDWLMNTFYDTAFGSADVEEGILFISLIRKQAGETYLTGDLKKTEPTAYARSISGFRKGYQGNYYYWLGGGTYSANGHAGANLARDTIIMNDGGDVQSINGVRPIIWVCPGGESTFPADYYYSGEIPKRRYTGSAGTGSTSSGKKVCSRCDGTGRVTKHFGNTWNKIEGYGYGDVCGQCGGTGYVDN